MSNDLRKYKLLKEGFMSYKFGFSSPEAKQLNTTNNIQVNKMLRIKTNQKFGYRISSIGVGGKEYNIRDVGYSKILNERKKQKEFFKDLDDARKYAKKNDLTIHNTGDIFGWSSKKMISGSLYLSKRK